MDIWYEGTCPTKTNPYQNRSDTSENERRVKCPVFPWFFGGNTCSSSADRPTQTPVLDANGGVGIGKWKMSQTTREECFWRVEKSSKRQCVASNSLASSPFPFFPFFKSMPPTSVSNKWYILRKNKSLCFGLSQKGKDMFRFDHQWYTL